MILEFIKSVLLSKEFLTCVKFTLQYTILLSIIAFFAILCVIFYWYHNIKKAYLAQKSKSNRLKIGFFHPGNNQCGGGEKVLWSAIEGLFNELNWHNKKQEVDIVVFSGETTNESQILKTAEDRFGVKFDGPITFQFVRNKSILEPKSFLTILRQIYGIILFTKDALRLYPVDIFIDTQGYSFSYFFVKKFLPKTKTCAYVHYPFISYDMIKVVKNKTQKFNNKGRIADWMLLRFVKVIYYEILIILYHWSGQYCDLIFTNSSWTKERIDALWGKQTLLVYPPCSISEFNNLPIRNRNQNGLSMLSFAQFRPEKNHQMQLRIFQALKRIKGNRELGEPEYKYQDLTFNIIGSCRNQDDENLLAELKQIIQKEQIKGIQFHVNVKYEQLKEIMKKTMIGIHTMEDEHFGITIVEMMAAGLITVAHNSAGAKQDIILQQKSNQQLTPNGYLCDNEQHFFQTIQSILDLEEEQRNLIQQQGRKRSEIFGDKIFKEIMGKQLYSFIFDNFNDKKDT